MGHIQAAMRRKLAELGFNPSDIDAMEEVFNEVEEPFKDLTTEYQQNAYFLNHFNLVVCYGLLLTLYVYIGFKNSRQSI